MCLTCFLAALEVTAVATALPDMVADLSVSLSPSPMHRIHH